MEPQMNTDKRRFIAWAYIALVRLFFSAALCKNQDISPQSAQSPQRAGGAGHGREVGGVAKSAEQRDQNY
jgi:hypothetical protein